ncbi:MAG: metal ABC transporter substrate-binding protein [Firmicutes bacterium]|nr:metal ABC transporter substrate-binding protein [Bacillota bacterium]
MRRIRLSLFVLVLLIIAVAFQWADYQPVRAQEKVQVVTTLALIGDWVKEVGGPYVEVHSLVSGKSNPHTFEPTIKDITLLQKADLFIEIGLGLEVWSDKLVASSFNSDLVRLTLSDKLSVCRFGPMEHKLGQRRHTVCNPHIWLAEPEVTQSISVIADYLAELLPAQAEYFRAGAIKYSDQISELFGRYKQLAEGRNLSLLTVVPTYSFLLKYLGITEIGPLVSGHGEQPSAKEVAQLADKARKAKAVAVISEANYDHGFGRIIAEETGLPLVNLEPTPRPGQSYLEFLKENLRTLFAALD